MPTLRTRTSHTQEEGNDHEDTNSIALEDDIEIRRTVLCFIPIPCCFKLFKKPKLFRRRSGRMSATGEADNENMETTIDRCKNVNPVNIEPVVDEATEPTLTTANNDRHEDLNTGPSETAKRYLAYYLDRTLNDMDHIDTEVTTSGPSKEARRFLELHGRRALNSSLPPSNRFSPDSTEETMRAGSGTRSFEFKISPKALPLQSESDDEAEEATKRILGDEDPHLFRSSKLNRSLKEPLLVDSTSSDKGLKDNSPKLQRIRFEDSGSSSARGSTITTMSRSNDTDFTHGHEYSAPDIPGALSSIPEEISSNQDERDKSEDVGRLAKNSASTNSTQRVDGNSQVDHQVVKHDNGLERVMEPRGNSMIGDVEAGNLISKKPVEDMVLKNLLKTLNNSAEEVGASIEYTESNKNSVQSPIEQGIRSFNDEGSSSFKPTYSALVGEGKYLGGSGVQTKDEIGRIQDCTHTRQLSYAAGYCVDGGRVLTLEDNELYKRLWQKLGLISVGTVVCLLLCLRGVGWC